MAMEQERRFLVLERRITFARGENFAKPILQGYVELQDPAASLRVRISHAGTERESGEATIKFGRGLQRDENNQKLDIAFAQHMLAVSHHQIEKRRFVKQGWEIDFFEGPLAGIIIAEFEADNPLLIPTALPEWIGKGIEVTETLTNLHLARLASLLKRTKIDALSFVLERLERKIRQVAIVGPPCSGKSSIIRILEAEFPRVKFYQEAATLVMGQLGIKPDGTHVGGRQFQQIVFQIAHLLERTSADIAISQDRDAVVFDRGKVDSAIYLPGHTTEYEELFQTTLTNDYKQYHAVIYLEKPPAEVFEREKRSNPERLEHSYNEVLRLDELTQRAWRRHPNFILVENGNSWEEKVAAARNALRQALS